MKIDMGSYEVWFVPGSELTPDRAQVFYDFLTDDSEVTTEDEKYRRILVTSSHDTQLRNLLKTPPFADGELRHGIEFYLNTLYWEVPGELYTCATHDTPVIEDIDKLTILNAIRDKYPDES